MDYLLKFQHFEIWLEGGRGNSVKSGAVCHKNNTHEWQRIVFFPLGLIVIRHLALSLCTFDLYWLGEVIKDPLKKKTSDLQTKNWGWSLRSTESISREFLSPGWKTKVLDVFENVTFGTDCIKFKIVFFNCLWANFTLLDNRN